MEREINPVCDFIFGSIHMCLLMDTVDVELTIRLAPWSKTVIPFPSLR